MPETPLPAITQEGHLRHGTHSSQGIEDNVLPTDPITKMAGYSSQLQFFGRIQELQQITEM